MKSKCMNELYTKLGLISFMLFVPITPLGIQHCPLPTTRLGLWPYFPSTVWLAAPQLLLCLSRLRAPSQACKF